MTTTKSFSSARRMGSMYRASLKNQTPFFVISAIFMLLCIPVALYISLRSMQPDAYVTHIQSWIAAYYRDLFKAGIYMDESHSAVVSFILMVMAFCTALYANRHMHSKKMTDLYHSLPITRTGMLVANAGASMTVVLGPYAAFFLLAFLAEAALYGRFGFFSPEHYRFILADFLSTALYVMIVYAFATFIAVHVGTVFDALAITGVVGFIPMIAYLIGGAVWAESTYGASFNPRHVMLLSPFTFMFERYGYVSYRMEQIGENYNSVASWDFGRMAVLMSVWAVIGALFFLAAVFFYGRRRSEIAEQTQPRGVFQVIVKCFAAFCGAMMFYGIFYDDGGVRQVVFMLLGAVVIGTIAELILSRGVRHLLRNLVWLAGTGVCCVLLIAAVRVDLFGYESRVPIQEQVQSVRLNYGGRFETQGGYRSYAWMYSYMDEYSERLGDLGMLSDPESIAVVLDMHRKAVSEKPPRHSDMDYTEMNERYPYASIRLEYKLKNGDVMKRSYDRVNLAAMSSLVHLEDKDDYIRATSPLFTNLPGLSLTTAQMLRSVSPVPLLQDDSYETTELPEQDMERLVRAMQQDSLDETLEQIFSPDRPAEGYLRFRFKESDELRRQYGQQIDRNFNFLNMAGTEAIMLVPAHYTRTLAVLRELGLYDKMASGGAAERVERVYVTNLSGGGWKEYDRVMTLNPQREDYTYFLDKVRNFRAEENAIKYPDDDTDILLEVSGKSDIAAVLAAGRSQMLFTAGSEQQVVIAVFEAEGKIVGSQYIRLRDLPPEMAGRLKTKLNEFAALEEQLRSSHISEAAVF